MWKKVLKPIKDALWWGIPGHCPTKHIGTDLEDKFKKVSHFSSRKFTMCFISLAIIVLIFLFATGMLFLLPPAAYTSFVAIHHELYVIIGLVVSVMIGATGLVSIANNNSTSVNTNNNSELINETEHIIDESVSNKNLREFQE